MHDNGAPEKKGEQVSREKASSKSGCEEHARLLGEFGAAVREILELHHQQFQATVEGDAESSRFDVLIHMAN